MYRNNYPKSPKDIDYYRSGQSTDRDMEYRSRSPATPHSMQDISAKYNALKKKFTRCESDVQRLRKERNQYRDDLQMIETENSELRQKYNKNTEELDARVANLNEEVLKLSENNEELRQKDSEFHKNFDLYKQKKNNEIKTLQNNLIKLNKDLDNEKQNKWHFESRLKVAENEKQVIVHRFSGEVRELTETKTENQGLKQRIETLAKEKDLLNKSAKQLSDNCRQLKAELKQKSTKSSAKLQNQLDEQKAKCLRLQEEFDKERAEMKSSFHLQLTALKRQRQHFMKSSEINKRKHISTEYLFKRHESMYKKNAQQINNSVTINTDNVLNELSEEIAELVANKQKRLKTTNTTDIADVVKSNWKKSDEIYGNAAKIDANKDENYVNCPECDKRFAGTSTLRTHLKNKHFIDSDLDLPENRVIDSIDLVDD